MGVIAALGCLCVVAAVVAWRRSIERAARARFDAEVNAKRVDDAKTVEQRTIAAIDAKTAADDRKDPVDLANDMIAAARRRTEK
jgi:hypothetical protein